MSAVRAGFRASRRPFYIITSITQRALGFDLLID